MERSISSTGAGLRAGGGGNQQGLARTNETSDPAIGDGVLVSGSNLVLELSSFTKTRWLGYKDLPDQRVSVAGTHLVTTPSGMPWCNSSAGQ